MHLSFNQHIHSFHGVVLTQINLLSYDNFYYL